MHATEYQEHGADRRANEDLTSEYLSDDELDVDHWARDALVLALPGKILCRPDCAGMCPRCGVQARARRRPRLRTGGDRPALGIAAASC